MDRRVIRHAGIFNWHLRDVSNVRNFTTFVPAGSWDKFASDLDVTEWENRTLVAFICGDQRTTGMAMLAEYGGPLDAWLASHFATSPSVNVDLKSDDGNDRGTGDGGAPATSVVFAAEEPTPRGPFAYVMIPRMVFIPPAPGIDMGTGDAGVLLVACEDHAHSTIAMRRSTDGGASFSAVYFPIAENAACPPATEGHGGCTAQKAQAMADAWCNLPAQHGCGNCTGRVARDSGSYHDPTAAWRCYCPECLTGVHSGSVYNASTQCKEYCTDSGKISGIIQTCTLPGTPPPAPKPGVCRSAAWREPTLVHSSAGNVVVLSYTRCDTVKGGCDSGEQNDNSMFRMVSTDRGLSFGTATRPNLVGSPSSCLIPTGGCVIEKGPHAGRQLYMNPREAYGGEVVSFTDDGVNWNVSTGLFTPGLDEANVAQTRNGSLFAVMRNCYTASGGVAHGCSLLGRSHSENEASVGPSAHRVATAISRDGGVTWTTPRLHNDLLTPTCQSSLIGYDGALLFVGPYSETSRTNLTVLASDDNGETFSRSLQLVPTGGSGYSAIACGLAPPLDCAVLFDTDNASLKLLKFSSQALKTVKTDDEGSVSRLNLTAPPPPPAFLPMGAVVTIHPLLAPQTALRHCYHDLYATAPGLGDKEDYDFVVEAGLSGAANTVSFRSLQLPTLYIHVDDPNQGVESNRISVDVPTSKVSASWVPVPVTKAGSAVSWRFRSSSSSGFMGTNGRLIGHCANRYPSPSSDVVLLPAASKELANSTFHVATVAHPPPTPAPGPPQPPPPAPPHLVHSKVTVDTSVKGPTITPHMTGCGLEDINHELNGGLYSQMVLDESFETTTNASLFNETSPGGHGANSGGFEPTSSWRAASGTTAGAVRIVSHPSLCFNGPSCLQMIGPGKARVTQSGLLDSGLFVLSDHNYTVSLSLALGSSGSGGGGSGGSGSSAVAVTMSLVDRISGKVISNTIAASCSSSSWTRFSGVFDATASSANASLSIAAEQLQSDVTVRVDMVILEPGDWGKFRGLPVRRDLAELIQLEQLTVMRLGGGMIDSNGWNWHHQIGPRELRPPNMCGSWDAVMSNGWGVFDFLNLAEELKIRPIVSVHLGTIAIAGTNASAAGSLCSPSLSNAGGDHDSGAFANVSDPAGYIEYLFGPAASTRWGAVRAQDGHPEPYRPFTMALSNEEGCGAAYQARAVAFMTQALARASQLASPPLLSFALACDGARFNHWRNDASTHAMTLACANLTQHYPPHLLEIFWDQHVNGDELDAPIHPTNFSQVFNDERLATRGWGLELPVVVLEENGNLHTLQRALGHLRNAFAFQAMGEHVLVQCYANCFQPLCHEPSGDCVTHYSQGGKMFLPGGPSALGDTNRTWLSPHGWSTQMLSASYRPQGLRVDITGDPSGPAGSDIRLHAMAAVDENETSMVVRVLNPTANVIQLVIDVVGDHGTSTASEEADDTDTAGSVITVDTLSGETLGADNSWQSPLAVHPVRSSSSSSVDVIAVSAGGTGGTGSTGGGRALMMINHTLPPLSFAVFTLPTTSKNDHGGGSGGATADMR
jgi:hypothetical protein